MEHEHATSLTARAVKRALPDTAILTKDARQTLNTATSVFTLYLATLAHENSVAHKRSTLTLKDVLQTLRDVDFEHFIEPIEMCLQEAKATESRIKLQKSVAEKAESGEMTSEVARQLDEVVIDTNIEDYGDDMMSVDELSDAEIIGDDGDEAKELSPNVMHNEGMTELKSESQAFRDPKAKASDGGFTELMEQS